MSTTVIQYTYDEFLEALNHQAFVASQIDTRQEMASYGFIALLLVMHSTTVLHPRAALGCFPQLQIRAPATDFMPNINKYPDFGSVLSSCVEGVTSVPDGVLRTWWEVKQFYDPTAADFKIYEIFGKTFNTHFPQYRAQAEAAFRAYPQAECFRMIASQGLRFALIEWSNPKMKQTRNSSSTFPWVEGQEKLIYKGIETAIAQNSDFPALLQYERAQSLLNDPTAYPQPRNIRELVLSDQRKERISRMMPKCQHARRPNNPPRIVYFAEPMFTLSDEEVNDWRHITGLTPQFRYALRAMCDPTNPNSPQFSFKPSFFDPPYPPLETEIVPTMGVDPGIKAISKAQVAEFKNYCEALAQDENLKLLHDHRRGSLSAESAPEAHDPTESASEVHDPTESASEAQTSAGSNWLPSHLGDSNSESPPDSPIATRRGRRVNRTQPNYVESAEESAKSTSDSSSPPDSPIATHSE